MDKSIFNHLRNSLKHRKRYSYTFADFLYNFCCPLKVRCPCRRDRITLHDRFRFHSNGVDKLTRELDVTEVLTSLRELRAAVACMMSENQRGLVKFHRDYIINAEPSEDEKPALKGLPKLSGWWGQRKRVANHDERISELVKAYEDEPLTDMGK